MDGQKIENTLIAVCTSTTITHPGSKPNNKNESILQARPFVLFAMPAAVELYI